MIALKKYRKELGVSDVCSSQLDWVCRFCCVLLYLADDLHCRYQQREADAADGLFEQNCCFEHSKMFVCESSQDIINQSLSR
jgi:hypothetical protein